MNVLILGKSGMLAHMVAAYFRHHDIVHEVLGRPEASAQDLDNWSGKLSSYDYVINCIGLTNRWEKKVEPSAFFTINSEFPHRLAERCAFAGARLIHVSTDCVFNGCPGPHYEDSIPDGEGVYAESKIGGEPSDKALVLRTSIIGPEKANFYSLLSWVLSQKGKLVSGYKDHLWNGITTYQLAECMATIIRRDQYVVGLRHLHSPGSVTKSELIQMIVDTYKLGNTRVKDVTSGTPRDMRLASIHPNFIKKLNIAPLSTQLQAIANNMPV